MLSTLMEGCRQHQPQHDVNDEKDVHQNCRDVLSSLSRALPQVESSLQLHSHGLTLEQWRQWADFYRNAGHGTFCPHSPQLLTVYTDPRQGRSSKSILGIAKAREVCESLAFDHKIHPLT